VIDDTVSLPLRSPGTRFSRAARIQSARVTGRETSGDSTGISSDDFAGPCAVTSTGSPAVVPEGALAVTDSGATGADAIGGATVGAGVNACGATGFAAAGAGEDGVASTSAGGAIAGATTRGVPVVVATVRGACGTGVTDVETVGEVEAKCDPIGAGAMGSGAVEGSAV